MTLAPQRLMTVPCVVVSRVPSGTDAYGSAITVEDRARSRCWYSQPSTEEREGRVFTSIVLYFGPDEVLDHATRVEVEGIGTWEIDGEPIAHRSPRTGVLTHRTARGRKGA
jgi:hypothetical protein